VAGRYLPWDRRLFGRPVRPEHLARDLESVLMDRPLSSFPTATRQGEVLEPVQAPFLDVWERPGLALCLPPYLTQLQGGIAAVNRVLRLARNGSPVGLPNIATRAQVFHGGVLHPGEPLPRSVPDTRSLRLRLLLHAPYAALMTALLLLHRQRPELVEVVRMKVGWSLRYRRERLGGVLDVLDDFAASRRWVTPRRDGVGLDAEALLVLLETLGIATMGGRRALLNEQFFARLRTEAEEMEVADRLSPLAASLDAHLEAVEPRA